MRDFGLLEVIALLSAVFCVVNICFFVGAFFWGNPMIAVLNAVAAILTGAVFVATFTA